MRHLPLYVVVSLSGAAVLALEILGTRVLGPFYGVSLFLWSALIGVTLAALAVGYALGGRWADRGPHYSRLGFLLAAAAAWVLLTPWIRKPLLVATEPLGLRAAVLVASFCLFFPPLTLLGMVSPYAVRLKASRLDEVGRTAGDLYAVSTIASVGSALLTGFVLIPGFGVNRLILLVGAVLLLAAAVAWLAGRQLRSAGLALLILGPALAALLWRAAAERPDFDRGLLSVRQSPYGEIRVLNRGEGDDEERCLIIDGAIHSMVRPGTWQSSHRYAVVLDMAKNLFDRPGNMLLVGLGAGSVAKSFSRDAWRVESVEIDPVVPEVARRYFGLDSSDGRIVRMDGRRFLARASDLYDLIVIDAYGGSSIPFQLVTTEAFGLAAARLKPGGILALNVECVGWDDPLVGALAATLKPHFSHVLALPTAEPPNTLGNVVLLAAGRPLEFPDEMLANPADFLSVPYMHWVVVQRNHGWNNRFEPKTAGSPVLTDDRSPIDLWAERINREARKDLHEYFGAAGLSW